MAVLIITGVAGTGKTLMAIQRYIIPELKKGGIVYTNIDGLVHRHISYLFGIEIFDLEANLRLLDDVNYFYKDKPKNALFVIDEAQNIFSNREWQAKHNCDMVNYLMEHRHYGHKIVFVTPHVDSLDAGIRRVAEFTYKNKSFSALGNKYTVRCAVFDQCNMTKDALQVFTWQHDQRIYQCYSSYFSKEVKEEKVRVYPLRNATLVFVLVLSLIAIIFGINNSSRFLKKISKKQKAGTIQIDNIQKNVRFKNENKMMINDSIIYYDR